MLLNLLRLAQTGQKCGDDVFASTVPALAVRTATRGLGDAALRERNVDLVRGVLAALHFRFELGVPPRHACHGTAFEVLAPTLEPVRESKLPDLRLRRPRAPSHSPSVAQHTGLLT